MAQMEVLKQTLNENNDLELAILIGSRANSTASSESDWDIAIQWQRDLAEMSKLAQTEKLRNQISKTLKITDNKIDFIDIPAAGLAIRDEIANRGIILKGENTLALSHFLTRTWRQLEEYYWDKIYAA